MFANASCSQTPNDNSNPIPEWKKKLLLKKRAGSSINIEEYCHSGMLSDNFSSHSEFNFPDVSLLKTVTIGNFNVELRSVSKSESEPLDRLSGFESENEDLQYGPGIVDRLRERFLNMGAKKQRKPVRRFSSLENLPCSFVRPFKLNTRNIQQNGFKVGTGNVKKAQSMETLISSTQDQPIFLSIPESQNHEIEECHTKSPSINEDELPKPDTVKHVKKLFEPNSAFLEKSREEGTGLKESSSIVFDFRGKDVQPHISLNPAPFGCKKRSGSPPQINGLVPDEEDWDEMDIGADLPILSGIVFTGENVKVGRGAILETRNKKLTIQFDDQATSTFEYPSENTSPSPVHENPDSSFNSLLALGSLANSRLSHMSTIDFESDISKSNPISANDDPPLPAIVPTKPEDASGWSSTNSTDILF